MSEKRASAPLSAPRHRRSLSRFLRGDLDWITLKATARQREMRYDSAAELANDIERHRRFEPVHAGPPGRLYVLAKFARRYRAAVLATGVVILALAGGVAARTLEAQRANREAAAARRAQTETAEVVEFLVDLFEVNDPGTSRGNTITARELLDRGAAGDPRPARRAAAVARPAARHHRPRLPAARAARARRGRCCDRRWRSARPTSVRSIRTSAPASTIWATCNGSAATTRRPRPRSGAPWPSARRRTDPDPSRSPTCSTTWARFSRSRPATTRPSRCSSAASRSASASSDRTPSRSPRVSTISRSPTSIAATARTAEPLFRRALAIREANLGADHPEVATTANGLGIALAQLRTFRRERWPFTRARSPSARRCSEPRATRSRSRSINLGGVYVELGRFGEAEAAILRATAIWEKNLQARSIRASASFT